MALLKSVKDPKPLQALGPLMQGAPANMPLAVSSDGSLIRDVLVNTPSSRVPSGLVQLTSSVGASFQLATPAFVTAALLEELDAALAECHASIPYASSVVVTSASSGVAMP